MPDTPQPPKMSDAPEKVIAWGEHLAAEWAAATPDTSEKKRRWQALTDFYAGWGRPLLKLARQGLDAAAHRASLMSALHELERATEQCVALRAENARLRGCLDLLRGVVTIRHEAWCPAMDLSPDPGACTCGMAKVVAALKGEVSA